MLVTYLNEIAAIVEGLLKCLLKTQSHGEKYKKSKIRLLLQNRDQFEGWSRLSKFNASKCNVMEHELHGTEYIRREMSKTAIE